MESEQTGLAFSLSLSLPSTCDRIHRLNLRMIIFFLARKDLTPSHVTRGCDTISCGLDDILLTAASDSEDFGPALADALPPSGLPWPTLSSWTCFRAPLRSSLWIGPMSPASLERRNFMSGFLAALIPDLKGGSCRFSVICIKRSPDPGSSLFPPALPTRQPLTSPTLWVLWSRATPPFLW